jgi:citronellol/citronellal dehydrogenase
MYASDLFKGKVVLVTGGRSGIGYGIAQSFLELGADVIIASRKKEPLLKAASELSSFGTCESQVCDIREPDQIEQLSKMIEMQGVNFLRHLILSVKKDGQQL